ncbi:MAG: PAS domain S-box protein, partial [Verrucomicrobiaceae bacterium]
MTPHASPAPPVSTTDRGAELRRLTKEQLIERLLSLEADVENPKAGPPRLSSATESAGEEDEEACRLQQALQQERNFVSAVLDTVGALVLVLDREGRIVRFNRACERISGYSFEEIRGQYVWDILLPSEDVSAVKNVFRQLRAGNFPNNHRNHWVNRHGQQCLIDWSNTVLTNSDGAVEYLIGTGMDITERHQAELALRETEARLEAIIDQAPVVVFVKDADGRHLLVNQEYLRTVEMESRDQVIGKTDFEIFPRKFAEQLRENDRQVWHTGGPSTVEEVFDQPFGSQTYISKKFLLTDSEGKPSALCGIVLDITANKQAADMLRRSEEHLRQVLDSLFIFVAVLSCDGTLLTANRSPLEAAGLQLEDVRGRKFWDCYWWNYSAAIQKHLHAAIFRAAQGEPSRYDAEVQMAGGLMMSIDFMLSPMRNRDGEITHLIASAVDITGRKQREREVLEVSAREQRRIGQDLHDDLCQRLTATEFLAHSLA